MVAGQRGGTCVLVKGALEQGKGSGELLGVSVLCAGLQHAPLTISDGPDSSTSFTKMPAKCKLA